MGGGGWVGEGEMILSELGVLQSLRTQFFKFKFKFGNSFTSHSAIN